ncbi:hypothetical protein SAMN05421825_0739 [Epilithonimonas hungarica]|uniref:C1q domain-containing protein n=1 Tax=Epilithonimonas hungarica TaxID=454006 RepID=A0A1G7HAF8_9FLAO|nr:hypothetical protein [Chryseobacterium sp.]SDE97422.1 hypothetical protein SAMN05421825_0739 [Epilithonimonas hungarica]
MKKKVSIIYQLLACTLIFSTSTIAAQTGVLTQNPSTTLHIDAADDNTATISTAQAANDVVVTTAGNLGVGVLAPVTKVDLRSADQKGIIGLGTNTQTAAAAGAGAIRYNSGNFLEYSDGANWIPMATTAPPKVSISGTTSDATYNISNNTSTRIRTWSVTGDTTGAFSSTNNEFTAPRNGFYLVSFSITLGPNSGAGGVINNSTFIETAIETSGVTTTTIPKFITVNSYPAFQASTIRNYISGNCNGIFYLNQGSKIFFTVKHTTGGTRTVLNDATLNNFSIQEL